MTADEESRLGRIEGKIDHLTEIVTVEQTSRKSCLRLQHEHHATLYGNGTAGLKSRVESLENDRKWERLIIGAVCTLGGIVTAAFLQWAFGIF